MPAVQGPRQQPETKAAAVPGGGARWWLPACALLAALICAALSWAVPRPQSDLYLALAGGRDVVEGRLAKVDDWSFATDGRVWVHQNWLADTVIYAAERAGGETGLLVLKGILVAAILAAVVLAARERGAGPAAGLLAAGAAVMSWPQAMILRANLFSLILAPLLLFILYRSRRRRHAIWFGVLLVWIWANTHGAFVFGLGMLGLWTIMHLAAHLRHGGSGAAWRHGREAVAATVVAVALAALANPFGLANLQVPFLVRSNAVWQRLTEWRPLFTSGPLRTPTPWIFLAMVAVLILGAVWTRWGGSRSRAKPGRSSDPDRVAVLGFELILAGILLVMAFQAQRFVLFSAVMLSPLVALQLQRILRPDRRLVPGLAAAGILVAAAILGSRWLVPFYSPDNPLRSPETLFGRMVYRSTDFPVGATTFLDANGIAGRVFNEWRWEGYLRWRAPQMKVYIGGRAHQAYSAETARERYAILSGRDAAARLRGMDVHLALVPLNAIYGGFVLSLLQSKAPPWAYVYCDRRSALLADLGDPATRTLVEGAAAGTLDYPDSATAALSRAMCLTSPATGTPPGEALAALRQAVELEAVPFAYAPLVLQARKAGLPDIAIAGILETEAKRLAQMPTDGPEGVQVLLSRRAVAQLLARLGEAAIGPDGVRRAVAAGAEADRKVEAIERRYR